MAGTGVGKFSSTAGSNTANMSVNFAENMAPSAVNNAARELMGHMRDMYEQLGDGYFEFGDGDGTYTVARGDADTITITSASDISGIYFAGRKIRITDGGANVVEGTIASSSHSSTTQTVNLTGISLASGTPTKVELGIDTAAFGGRVILDDDGDTYIEAPTDDTIDIYVAGAKDFVITANTFTAESGSTIAAQALTATTVTASGIIKTDDTTNATSTTDGSLQTDGGLSVALDAVIGDDLFMKSDSSVIHFGADSDVTLTHVADTGLIIRSEGTADTLSIVSGDDGTAAGPSLELRRDSASPADNDGVGAIVWTGRNDNSQDYQAAIIKSQASDVSDGSEDSLLYFRTMHAGSEMEHMAFLTTETVFNDPSNDIDFRVESNGNTNMFKVNAGNNLVGIGADPDLGAGLHIKTADSGATATAHGDELVIEDGTSGANVGISILSATDGEARINFGDSGDNDIGQIRYDHADNKMHFVQNNASQFTISGSTSVTTLAIVDDEIASGGETAPDVGTGGLCLNQGSSDNNILTFKSSDVAHGMTTNFETDTFAAIRKQSATEGGLAISSQSEGIEALKFNVSHSNGTTTKSSSGVGAVIFGVSEKSGTSVGGNGTNDNLLVITDHTSTRFIFDAEGDFHADSSSTTFDTYEDAQLVRAYDLSHGKGVINSQFDKYIQYQHEDLADAGLVGREDDGTPNHFINVTGFQRLHNGAIWQQYEKHQRLAKAVYELAKVAVGEDKANEILEQNEIKLLN